jgi:hypothetical protein
MTTRHWLAGALVLAASSTAMAQRGGAASRGGSCRLDTNATWFKRQRTWFDEAGQKWSNDTLRASLLRATGLSPSAPVAVQWGWAITDQAPTGAGGDSAMIAALLTLARTRGSPWPTRSAVGAVGTHAVAMLALRDTSLGRVAVRRMMEAGPDESPAADVAMLEDKLRLLAGRKQIYGTQFQRTDKGLVLAPMEDSAHVDLRREDAGLPPFIVSACLARASASKP